MTDIALGIWLKNKNNNFFLTNFPHSNTCGTMIDAGIYFADFSPELEIEYFLAERLKFR
jgi:hypothetical protein